MKKKIISMGLMVAMVVSLTACGKPEMKAEQIGKVSETTTKEQTEITYDLNFEVTSTEFALELLKACYSADENVMISPISMLAALSMTANGAEGETLSQMEEILVKRASIVNLNQNLSTYLNGLPSSEDAKVSIANSIWFTNDESLSVNQEFLDLNNATYRAEIYKAAFDEQTLKDINYWVSDKTDGMITDILDKMPQDAVMYLINAVAFDAKWKDKYFDYQVREQSFTTQEGEESQVPMMNSEEKIYLEDELATGFCKPYREGYTFVALLPNEGVTVEEYINSLNAESFRTLLEEEQRIIVYATLPKFTAEYKTEMKDVLKAAGMEDAFDANKADFSKLGSSENGNIYISRVLHKTFIEVDEEGTRASAATVVETKSESAMIIDDFRNVVLDRPFIYAIIDNENKLPIFIGSIMNIE